MTKIQITPTWPEVKPQGFYVYVHMRAETGEPFYVGKGIKARGWVYQRRGVFWDNVAKKNGVSIRIEEANLTKDQAFSKEMEVIARLRAMGCRLVNQTNGGDGPNGGVSSRRKDVYCSNGIRFDSLYHAADWLKENGYKSASASPISSCARGKQGFCYGHAWSYDCFPDHPEITSVNEIVSRIHKTRQAKPVICSNGMRFQSNAEAARWLKTVGHPLARDTHISSCARGKRNIAYGFTWRYE